MSRISVSVKNTDYLDFIRMHPCADCGKIGPSIAHHVSFVDGTRIGGKADDEYTIPLCMVCHNNIHAGYGMDEIDILRTMVKLLVEERKKTHGKKEREKSD